MTKFVFADDLPWIELSEGVRCKSTIHEGRIVRVLEFAQGFAEKEWCCKAHIGYLIKGTLEIAFERGIERVSAGDILLISAGDQHRARVIAGPVQLFLVEEGQS